MNLEDFTECWNAACRHDYAQFFHDRQVGMSMWEAWTVRVGNIDLVIEGGSPTIPIEERPRAHASINRKRVDDLEITGAMVKPLVDQWEASQFLDMDTNKDRVMKYLNKPNR